MSTTIPDTHLDLLETPGTAIISTLTPDGLIQSTAVWFLYEDGQVKVSMNDSRRKLRNVQENPTATIFFIDAQNPFRTLEVRGKVDIALDADRSFAERVGAKYSADLSTFDEAGQQRYTLTFVPDPINSYG